MITVQRINSRFKPKFNTNNSTNYIHDESLVNLIKRTDEACERYKLEYAEPIYKVVETSAHGSMDNSYVRLKSGKTRYTGQDNEQSTYYEAKLIKKEVVSA